MRVVRAITIGWRARAALERSGGRATVRAPLTASLYAVAGTDLVWLGAPSSALHGRAIVCGSVPRMETGALLTVDLAAATTWYPPPVPSAPACMTMIAHAHGLRASAPGLGTPAGFAGAWRSAAPPFPLERAGGHAHALAVACAAGDAGGARRAALALLGVGAGLTPSGDDYVGGAFFARALLAAGRGGEAPWRAAGAEIVIAAADRTHPISAALLADHVDGHGYAALHALARGLADGDDDSALLAARGLVALGHSSGWDIMAGFLAGLGVG